MIVELSRELKIKLLRALKQGFIDLQEIPELTGEQPLFVDIDELSDGAINALVELVQKQDDKYGAQKEGTNHDGIRFVLKHGIKAKTE